MPNNAALTLTPGQYVRTTTMLRGYYYDESDDGSSGIDCVYLGTLGRVVEVPDCHDGQTIVVDFGRDGHWRVNADEIEVLA